MTSYARQPSDPDRVSRSTRFRAVRGVTPYRAGEPNVLNCVCRRPNPRETSRSPLSAYHRRSARLARCRGLGRAARNHGSWRPTPSRPVQCRWRQSARGAWGRAFPGQLGLHRYQAPYFGSNAVRVDQRPLPVDDIGIIETALQQCLFLAPNFGVVPLVRPPPARRPADAKRLRWQHLALDARFEHERDAAHRVVTRRLWTTYSGVGLVLKKILFDYFPQLIR